VSKGTLIAELLRTEALVLSFHDLEPTFGPETWQRFAKDVFELLARPNYMIGSDGVHLGAYPHPRAYGTFARLLRLSREENFPLETLIQRMTELPCRRFGLERRGRVQPGFYADLALFSPERVTDRATVQEPRLRAEGMDAVWVNGHLALDQGRLTGTRAGRVLAGAFGQERKPVI
jgi:N-acyl-D-amino-acid deacylase